jgi:flagellar motor switch protein FliN
MASVQVELTDDQDDLFDVGVTKKSRQKVDELDPDDVPHGEVDFLHDVPISVRAQTGRSQISMKNILALKSGSIVEFQKVVGEPMDIYIGGRLMCRGEIVVVNERYGIRISEVIRSEDVYKELDTSTL